MNAVAQRWEKIYNDVPLATMPGHFSGTTGSPLLFHYLTAVLRVAPKGGWTLETGLGSGYGSIWLSVRGMQAQGIDYPPAIVEAGQAS